MPPESVHEYPNRLSIGSLIIKHEWGLRSEQRTFASSDAAVSRAPMTSGKSRPVGSGNLVFLQ